MARTLKADVTKRKKAKKQVMPAHVDRLYKAVTNYVEKCGGKLLVIGGIQIEQWPHESEHKFVVGVKCLGRKPKFSEEPK